MTHFTSHSLAVIAAAILTLTSIGTIVTVPAETPQITQISASVSELA